MANTPFIVSRSWPRFYIGLAGVFALLGLSVLCFVTLMQNGLSQTGFLSLLSNSYLHHVLVVTVKQALLSVGFACLIGVFAAISFNRRARFTSRSILLLICFSCMIMPTTVAALSLLKLWGQSGLLAQSPLGYFLPDRPGLWLVVLAHVFFNAPLVMRVCLTALEAIPQSHMRQAALLDLSPVGYFLTLEWPTIRQVLPSIAGLVFLLCFTSFSLVLMLGGGPAVTTLEVSIYTALRFDFNLSQAAMLAMVQLVICASILWFIGKGHSGTAPFQSRSVSHHHRSDRHLWHSRLFDSVIIAIIIMLNIMPVLLLAIQSDLITARYFLGTDRFLSALSHSLTLAIGSAFLALFMSLLLSLFAYECQIRNNRFFPQLLEISHSVFLIVPALVMGTALFILLRNVIDITQDGFWLVLFGNSLLALPFCYRIVAPALTREMAQHENLTLLLHITGARRFFMITYPAIQTEIGFALGLSAALSFGDLGIITLFGSQSFETLPYLLFQFLNRYGAAEADILAICLLLLSAGLYLGFVAMGRLLPQGINYWTNRASSQDTHHA